MAKVWVSCGMSCGAGGLEQTLTHVELRGVNRTMLERWLRQDGWRYTKAYGWICEECAAKKKRAK
jgi:hypothetical protein